MALTNTFNVFEIMKSALEQQVKAQLTEDIVEDHMKQVEKEFREKLASLVESVSIDLITLDAINNMNGLMKEFKVYVEIRDGEK